MTTANGALSYISSYDPRVDFCFKTVRKIEDQHLFSLLNASLRYKLNDTLKLLFYVRDCRGGKGERAVFISCMRWIFNNHDNDFTPLLQYIPEYGTYKDLLLCALGTKYESAMLKQYACVLANDVFNMQGAKSISLAAKWAPSSGRSIHKKYPYVINKLIKYYNKYRLNIAKCANAMLSVKNDSGTTGVASSSNNTTIALKRLNYASYRKTISKLRARLDIVEKHLCNSDFGGINYEHVPGVAMNLYKKTFTNNDSVRFAQYLDNVRANTASIKTATVFPYQLVQDIDETSELMYKQMVRDTTIHKNTLVVVDTSGSMDTNTKPNLLQVAISLGLLINDCSTNSKFPSNLISFSTTPQWIKVNREDSLKHKYKHVSDAAWCMTTNLFAVFTMILKHAISAKLRAVNMPEQILILSDMQFDSALGNTNTNFALVEKMFEDSNYKMPRIVFWNLSGKFVDFPATCNDRVLLVSGFSQSVCKLLINNTIIDPSALIDNIINSSRYSPIFI
jgi:hypothetical protein